VDSFSYTRPILFLNVLVVVQPVYQSSGLDNEAITRAVVITGALVSDSAPLDMPRLSKIFSLLPDICRSMITIGARPLAMFVVRKFLLVFFTHRCTRQ